MITLKNTYHNLNFSSLATLFEKRVSKWKPYKNVLSISQLYGIGSGVSNAVKLVHKKGMISEPIDFKGIYMFSYKGSPFYVGMSKNVLKRICQHVKGTNHYTSSLCYRIGADHYALIKGKKHSGGRIGLNFKKYGRLAKKELSKCDVAVFPVEDDLELYLFEVFLAMKFGTLTYNSFKTH